MVGSGVVPAWAPHTRKLLAGGFLAIAVWMALTALAPASGWACSNVEFIGVRGDSSACSAMKILVAGFSQGAHVVGDTIENLTNKNDSSLAHIYGVALYGDPRFSKDDHATARGNYNPEHWGILTERGNYSSKINNRLGDWCRLYDAICQGFNAGDTAHHEYKNYEGGLFLQQGAEMMFSHIGW